MTNDYKKNDSLRTSVRISEELFKQKVLEFIRATGKECGYPLENFEDAPMAVEANERTKYDLDLLIFRNAAGLDLCYGLENATCVPGEFGGDFAQPDSLVGLHTLKNGLTFLGCAGGDDGDEIGTFFIIYYDGTQIRAYMPKNGVAYNRKLMTLWGYEQERRPNSWKLNDLYDKNQLLEEFPGKAREINELFEKYGDVDDELQSDLGELILEWYEDENKPFFDWRKIEADIMETIKVID